MVDKELFEALKKALEGNLSLMRQSFDDLAKQCEGMPIKEQRAFLTRSYIQLVSQHGAYASVAALEFYETLREIADTTLPYTASAFSPKNEWLVEYDAKSLLSTQQEIEKILSKLFSTGSERVMGYADETLIENARADPAHPKWALVPNTGACAWCQMIASQGFVYKAEGKVKNTRHPNCKCTPVVDFDTKNPFLDGYDPDALYDRYKTARNEAENGAWEEWSELPESEKEKYGGKRRGAYDHFLRNRIVAHV